MPAPLLRRLLPRRRALRTIALLIVSLAAPLAPLAARDGSIDTTYGGLEFGRVRVAFDAGGNFYDLPQAARVLTDGRLIAVGSATLSSGVYGVAVAVRRADGHADTSVAPGGKYQFALPSGSFNQGTTAIAADGSYYLIGSQPSGPRLRVWHYSLAGQLLDGPHDFGDSSRRDSPNAALVDAQGRLLIAYVSRPTAAAMAADDAYVLRMRPDGSPDPGFGTAGVSAIAFDPAARDDALALAELSDGSYVACGQVGNFDGSKLSFGIAKLQQGGALDTGFNGTGLMVDQLAIGGQPADTPCSDIGVVEAGSIIRYIITGRACPEVGTCSSFVLATEPDGDLIPSFGPGGFRLVSQASPDSGFPRLAIGRYSHDIGRIYLAQLLNNATLTVTRLSSLGANDPTYGDSGGTTTVTMTVPAVGGTQRRLYPQELVLTPRGLHIAAQVELDAGNGDFALIRLLGGEIFRDGFE